MAIFCLFALTNAVRAQTDVPAHRGQDRAARPPAAARAEPSFQFAFGGNVAQLPMEVTDRLVFVPVRVNGGEPSWFLLDTASPRSSLDDVRAAALGLSPTRSEIGGSREEGLSHVVLEFPGLKVSLPWLALASYTERSSRVGRAIQGVLGADVLGHLVVSINYERLVLQLFKPASYQDPGGGQKLKMPIRDGLPAVEAKVQVRGRGVLRAAFRIATAQSQALSFSPSFAELHRFSTLRGKTVAFEAEDSNGSKSRLGRLRGLQIGKFSLPDPLAIFPALPPKTKKSRSPSLIGGGIGGDVLDRFTVVLDYSRQLLILAPNYSYPDRFTADMSGIVLIALSPRYRTFLVDQVLEKSPASAAGIVAGDALEAIDGHPASEYTLDELRALLRQQDLEHRLTIRHGQKLIQLTLKLKPLI